MALRSKLSYWTASIVCGLEGKGESERQAMSLDELVAADDVPVAQEAISLEAVVEEPYDYSQISMVELPLNGVQLGLTLEVSGKKKGQVRKAIEERVLSPFQMVKLKHRGKEYELTVGVKEDDQLSAITDQMEWDMELLAELDDCSVKMQWLDDAT